MDFIKPFICIISMFCFNLTFGQNRYYVDSSKVDNSGDGLSWASAKNDLQHTINVANGNDEIWVKKGTYYPSSTTNNDTLIKRDYTFHIYKSLKIYGGFSGFENNRNERDSTSFKTILSGDIGTKGDNSDNCYRVIVANFIGYNTKSLFLDSFWIKDGNANVQSSDNLGYSRSIVGGAFLFGGSNKISNVKFSNNYGNRTSCINQSENGKITISRNIFSDNSSFLNLIEVHNSSINTIEFNIIKNNQGGISIQNLQLTKIRYNVFVNNRSPVIYAEDCTSSEIHNNLICENYNPGGFQFGRDGSIYIGFGSAVKFFNNTIVNNTGVTTAGLVIYGGGNNEVSNNVFWNNKLNGSANVRLADYYSNWSGGTTFRNNLFQLSLGSYSIYTYNGVGEDQVQNIYNQNPNFLNVLDLDGYDNIFNTNDDGYNLKYNSALINSGNSQRLPIDVTLDLKFSPRTFSTNVDIGAYEFNSCVGSPSISNISQKIIALGQSTKLEFFFDGVPPFNFSFNNQIYSNFIGKKFDFVVSPIVTSTYQVLNLSNTLCGNGIVPNGLTVIVDSNHPCLNVREITNITKDPGNYFALENIVSSAIQINNATYIAGKSITLNPGFKTEPIGKFEAKIGGCPNN